MSSRTPHPIDRYVGQRVKVRRTLSGLSMTKLAEMLGITFQQLQKYESGANRISASRLHALSHQLEVPIEYFFPEYHEGGAPKEAEATRKNMVFVQCLEQLPVEVRNRIQALVVTLAGDET